MEITFNYRQPVLSIGYTFSITGKEKVYATTSNANQELKMEREQEQSSSELAKDMKE